MSWAATSATTPPSTALEEGFFAGTPRAYQSYSAHAYWGAAPGSRPVRLKLNVIGIRYEELTAPVGTLIDDVQQHTLGIVLLGAVRVHPPVEVFACVGRYDPTQFGSGSELNIGGLERTRFVTAGGSFSLNALRDGPYRAQRITLAYAAFPEDLGAARHLLVLQLQLLL